MFKKSRAMFDPYTNLHNFIRIRVHMVYLLLIIICGSLHAQTEPAALYLTWKQDPTTNMVIDWHVIPGESLDSMMYYRKSSDEVWNPTIAQKINFPFSDRIIFRKEITGLSPDTRYAFKLGGYDRTYFFETMPQNIDDYPLMFAVGGDTYDRGHKARRIWMERMNTMVMKYSPKFILWGGDLAYADGKPDQVWRWYEWFDAIKNTLISPEGNVIPIIVNIGNHETNEDILNLNESLWNLDATRLTLAPFFYQLLSFPGQPGYKALDFGKYLSILALDTDHSNPISGEQTQWLKKTLRKRKKIDHVFPSYHVPAYPSVKPFDQDFSVRVRKYWTPLFDKYEVPMAFEFHDHVYKRTPRIKSNKIDPKGTLYIGDGGWGTQLRTPKAADTVWYLDKTARERNVVLVSLYQEKSYIRVVNEFGQIIDEYPDLFGDPSFTYPVSSLIPAGGSTFSAELAKRSGRVHIDSDFSGYSMGGFAWFGNTSDTATLEWIVPVHRTEDFTLRFRYSHPGPENGELQILVNESMVEHSFSFSATEKENRWEKSNLINTFLRKGENNIKIRSTDGSKAPRIDRLEIFPAVH